MWSTVLQYTEFITPLAFGFALYKAQDKHGHMSQSAARVIIYLLAILLFFLLFFVAKLNVFVSLGISIAFWIILLIVKRWLLGSGVVIPGLGT